MGNVNEGPETGRTINSNDCTHNKNQDHARIFFIPKYSKKIWLFFTNTRGLSNKKLDELSVFLSTDPPHIICMTEHHLRVNKIDTIVLANYNLGAKFCRNTFRNGGVCIFTQETVQFTNINLSKFCEEKDLEICAVKLHLLSCEICIATIYRSPTADFLYFMDNLEKILNIIYSNTIEIKICGDININYLSDPTHKQLLDSLLTSYGLCSTVQFPPRIQNNSHSATDNIFINTFKFSSFSVYPIINGLSDHDAQCIVIRNIFEQNSNTYFHFNRKIDKSSIMDFNTKLSYESWENIFGEDNVNIIFNHFLNMYLRIFYSSFPLKKSIINLVPTWYKHKHDFSRYKCLV
jgi:hypothetical protein